jgi:hypothetical protein
MTDTIQQQLVWKTLQTGSSKELPLLPYVMNKKNQIDKIGKGPRKESKNAKAYKEEENAHLEYFMEVIADMVQQAFPDDPQIIRKTNTIYDLSNNFEFSVIVSKKDPSKE